MHSVIGRLLNRNVKFNSITKVMFSSAPVPIVELREYDIQPEHVPAYIQKTTETAALRQSLVPLRLFTMPDIGGKLNVATHAYYYEGGHAERDEARKGMAQNEEWKGYLNTCRPYMQSQTSNIFVESPLVQKFDEVQGLSSLPTTTPNNNCIFELRRYKLILGYDTVPKFMKLYEAGLSSKLAAQDSTTSLVTLIYSDVGRLNEVIEIWRHGDGTGAMERSRIAARGASAWRSSIAEIAPLAIEFTSTIHKPTSFSPFQ